MAIEPGFPWPTNGDTAPEPGGRGRDGRAAAPPEPERDRFEEWLAPLRALPERPGPAALNAALLEFRHGLGGVADGQVRAVVVSGALDVLKARKVPAAREVLDAALPRPAAADDAKQGRALSLEDPAPWPERVEAGPLLDSLADLFGRFLVLPKHGADALALWTLHAHAIDAFDVTPYLALTSATPRCGKTRALELLSLVSRRPLAANNVRAAHVFRVVEEFSPTLLLDESDSASHESDELRTLLNAGYSRATSAVPRCVGDDNEVRLFDTFSAKAFALIGRLPGTLADRAIVLRMKRRAKGERVDRFRRRAVEPLAEELRRKAVRWATDNLAALRAARPVAPTDLDDRAQDIWEAPLAVADLAAGEWPGRARAAALALSGPEARGDADGGLGLRLLADVRDLFRGTGADVFTSTALVERLVALEEAPWADLKGKRLTTTRLGRLLGEFGIVSHKGRDANTYTPDLFRDAWERYLAPEGPLNAPTLHGPACQADSGPNPTLHGPAECGALKNGEKPDAKRAGGALERSRPLLDGLRDEEGPEGPPKAPTEEVEAWEF